jgi:dephospho-CoA kinase
VIRVGLTGTLGAGKSTVGRYFELWGARRIDTDALAREVVQPGRPALERVRETWGETVVAADGTMDRAALRRLIAEDAEARERLERIVHPEVLELLHARLDEARSDGCPVVVIEVPLLYETGLARLCDLVVVVDAPVDERERRVLSKRGLSSREFLALNDAQLSGEEKRERADIVVENNGSLEELEEAARLAWDSIDPTSPGSTGVETRDGGGRWSVDLHMHTWHSKDCLSDPADVVATARRVGLDRIAVTDHDQIQGAFEASLLAPDLVIIGEEVRTAEGLDLIGLFLTAHIAPGQSLRAVADEIHDQGGVVYLPHPFDRWRGGDEGFFSTVIDCVDVVEVFNARVHDAERNERARLWAERQGLPIGAGSDAHTLGEIGAARVRLDPFERPDEFVRSARSGDVVGSPSGHWVHLGSTWAKIRKRVPF